MGLALGTGACLLILLFVQDELSYEKDWNNNEQIYRLVQDFPMGTHLSQSATVPFPNRNTMLEDFPEITNAALIFRPSGWGNSPVLKIEDDEFFEDDFIFAEHGLLEMYNFKFIEGDPSEALKESGAAHGTSICSTPCSTHCTRGTSTMMIVLYSQVSR
jgi:putative ABC transport system permease protein